MKKCGGSLGSSSYSSTKISSVFPINVSPPAFMGRICCAIKMKAKVAKTTSVKLLDILLCSYEVKFK